MQEDLGKVGIKVTGVPASQADFYTKYLQVPTQASAGACDLAICRLGTGLVRQRRTVLLLAAVRRSPVVPAERVQLRVLRQPEDQRAHRAGVAAPDDEADALWAEADKQVMEDAAFFPITSPKTANYHAEAPAQHGPMDAFQNYDPTNVWIEKALQD